MTHNIQTILSVVGLPLRFDLLVKFIAYLEVEYGGFQRDQIQRIQNFQKENDDTSRAMYTHMTWFVVELRGVFAESQLVKILLSKINKRLFELTSSWIILDYESRIMLAQIFVVVERYNRTLYQHDDTDMVSWITGDIKPRRIITARSNLTKTQPKKGQKILYCWGVENLAIPKIIPIAQKRRKLNLWRSQNKRRK